MNFKYLPMVLTAFRAILAFLLLLIFSTVGYGQSQNSNQDTTDTNSHETGEGMIIFDAPVDPPPGEDDPPGGGGETYPPPTPNGTLHANENCGSSTLTVSGGSKPNGVTWYWQTSASGTSTSHDSRYSYRVYSSGTYYLRANDRYTSLWSSSTFTKSIYTTVVGNPSKPPTPAVSGNSCGNKTLTRSSPPAGITYYWQGKDQHGTSTSNSATTYSASSSGTYYIRAHNHTTGCWSLPVAVSVSVTPNPAPATSTTFKIGKGYANFATTGGSGTYYWYTSASSSTPLNSQPAKSIARFIESTTTLYAASVNGGGCVSTKVPVKVTVSPFPVIEAVGQEEINFGQEWVALRSVALYTRYQWYKDGEEIEGATSRDYKALKTGYYQVAVGTSKVKSDPHLVESGMQTDDNYSILIDVLTEGAKSKDDVIRLPSDEKNLAVTYYDGLGRPSQKIAIKASPGPVDRVQVYQYTPGLESKSYLSYSVLDGSGLYNEDWESELNDFYQSDQNKVANTTKPYGVAVHENSPLRRVKESGAPGEVWQPGTGHSVTYGYKVNDGAEDLRVWQIHESTGLPHSTAVYSAGDLILSTATDEEGKETRVYIDGSGRTVFKETTSGKTYWVYDGQDRLRYVIPPRMVYEMETSNGFTPSQELVDQYAFQYEYDEKHRLVASRVPGAGWEYRVYDFRDRVILFQNSNQRQENKWSFIKYDALDRPVLTGIVAMPGSRSDVQADVDAFYDNTANGFYETGGTAVHGYTNQSFPNVPDENAYRSVVYYDNYTFPHASDAAYDFSGTHFGRVKGLVTGGKVKILGSSQWLKSVNYYNDEYRLVHSVMDNHLGGHDKVTAGYDFTGRLTQSLYEHVGLKSVTIKQEYHYDRVGRLIRTYQTLDGDRVLLAQYKYNELGQLIDKKLHSEDGGQNFAQSVDYRYNIRGWLTSINNSSLTADLKNDETNDLFGTELFYTYGFDAPRFNGSVSGTRWKSKVDNTERAYGYLYDEADRLSGADYVAGGTGNWTKEADRYEVSNINYDRNGNIQTINRNGLFRKLPGQTEEYGVIDQLDYQYTGNRLMAVNDAITTPVTTKSGFKDNGSAGTVNSPEYVYDNNGNLTRDDNKGILSIDYNFLNLPEKVDFGEGKYIEYIYDAAGRKLSQRVYENNARVKKADYIGGVVYEDDTLRFMHSAEGRVVAARDHGGNFEGWEYQYDLKDHLGNTRLTFTTAKDSMVFEATMESEYAGIEEVMYTNLPATRHTDLNGNHTVDATITANEAASLNGTDPDRTVGPAIVLPVYPGDTVKMEVFASYVDGTGNEGSRISLAALTTAVAGAFGGAINGTEQAKAIYNAIEEALLLAGGASGAPETDVPRAFINFLLFDKNMVPLTPDEGLFGYQAISGAASQETGPTHEKLELAPVAIKKEGFIYVYLSNESNVDVNILFDDMKVTLVESPIVQAQDYTPFGLAINGYKSPNKLANRFLFNRGSELNEETAWYETYFRSYDPAIGRFTGIDPYAGLYPGHSPYHYALNDPANYNDPTGGYVEPNWRNYINYDAFDNMGGGSIGPGSGNHWTDQYSAMGGNHSRNAAMMSSNTFNSFYGISEGNRADFARSMASNNFSENDLAALGNFLGGGNVSAVDGQLLYTMNAAYASPSYPDAVVGAVYSDYIGMGQSWWDVQTAGILSGDYTLKDVVNYGMAGTGFVLGGTEAHLRNVKTGYAARGTKTAQRVITKVMNPSIAKVASTAKVLGWVGVGLNAGIVGYNWANGQDITATQVADLAIGAGLILLGGTVAVFSAPAALVAVGAYGILDAAGAFDGVKESLGGNTVVIEGFGGL